MEEEDLSGMERRALASTMKAGRAREREREEEEEEEEEALSVVRKVTKAKGGRRLRRSVRSKRRCLWSVVGDDALMAGGYSLAPTGRMQREERARWRKRVRSVRWPR